MNIEQDTALTLEAMGHQPVPVAHKEKKATRPGWTTEILTKEEILREFSRPSNLGVLMGLPREDGTFPVAIDVDVDSAPLLHVVSRAIGSPAPQKHGKKGGTFFVRAEGEVKTRKINNYHGGAKTPVIDILAAGSQSVIPPSTHPQTQLPYKWAGKLTLLNTKFEDLPLIDWTAIDEIAGYCKKPDDPIVQLNDMIWSGVGGGGNTHDICLAAAGSMVNRGWSDEQIHRRINRAKHEACESAGVEYDWPAAERTIQGWVDSAREKGFDKAKSKSKAKPSHGELANLVLSQHGAVIRRDKARRDWCVYNGRFWDESATEEVKTLIRQCLTDDQVFRMVIDGVESIMRLYPSIGVKNDAWDRDKHYLNCPDGTYDLKTRERLPHSPAHLITKMTTVSPRFDYHDSLWVKAISTWFGDDPIEIEYIQTLFGLFLTGETKDECVAMWIGKSGAGKSKMTEILDYIMGDYAQTATDTAFLEVRYHPHQEEIARMRGKRLVFIHEVEGYLNLRRVKSIASGESTSASFKGKDSFQFNPEAKIWFVGNEAPPTKSSGRELQRRFHVYEFMRQIDEKDIDVNLRTKLRDEAEFILGWTIDGAVKYYKNGLHRSPHVVESTNKYFADADIIEQWVEENCIADQSAITPVVDLFQNFDAWAEDARVKATLDKGRFSQRVKAKGFTLDRKTLVKGKPAVRVVVGLRLRELDETAWGNVVREGDIF